MSLWWLSFADAGRDLGYAIVEAVHSADAIRVASATGCNPGGEHVKMWRIKPDMCERLSFDLPIGLLLSPDDARALANRISTEIDS